MIAARSCIAANKREIERQLRYESFDKKLIGFMASYRMHREFDATRPDLLTEDKCPTSEDLNFVRSRLEAYARGRRDAVEILSGLVFVKALLAGRDLPFEKQTVEHSQPRFPRHLFVARLKAFGKCSDRLLAHFMTQEFFQLSNEAMKDFCDGYKQPPVGREDYDHLRLWAWLAENAPAFNLCKAQWLQIFKEVISRFRPGAPEGCRSHPPNEDSLKKQWHDFAKKHGLSKPPRITPPEGPRSKVTANLITDLLTPVPDFSTVN